ncbi:hypothetical protein AMTR_s00061p00118690 [Amborella trichopoda]|uniref:BZIP domain-containing protein n=1 Tax=Amborella trichopoda TaxID=13333 RepID=U5D0G9_AMBTC|nr:hypothetical protein AMTR_s00061p00118690 [Amborella trichopoda]
MEYTQTNGSSPTTNGVQTAASLSIWQQSNPSNNLMLPFEQGSYGAGIGGSHSHGGGVDISNVIYFNNVNGNGVLGNVVRNGGQVPRRRRNVMEALEELEERKRQRKIKNRESAARSRARKQAYTCQLDISVAELKEENARLKNELVF